MLDTDLTAALIADHSHDLARAAESSRLVAQARRGRPSIARRLTTRLAATIAAPGRRTLRADAPCCA